MDFECSDKRVATGTLDNNPVSIQKGRSRLLGWYFFNGDAATVYVQFFDSNNGSPALGFDKPIMSLGIPAGAAANVFDGEGAVDFYNGITIAATATRDGNGAPGTPLAYNVFFA